MRQLTQRPQLGSGNIKLLERIIGQKIPDEISEFLIRHAGLSFYERYYKDKNGTIWEIQQFCKYKDLNGLTREFKDNGLGYKLAFAFDPGGWHYCMSFDEETRGKILVNRWTDYPPEEQFIVIANSFEDFVYGLYRREDEV